MDLLRRLVSVLQPSQPVAPALTPPLCCQDLRAADRSKHPRGKSKGRRAWSRVVGITWHQTAEGVLDADHPGLVSCPVHIIVHRDGTWSWLHDFDEIVWAAHALNGGTVSVEIDCRAAGIEGDGRTFWRSKNEKNGYTDAKGRVHPPRSYESLVMEATDAQLAAIPVIMRYICARVAQHGGRVRANWTHRQGRDDRTSDPGSRIWAAVERAEATMPELALVDVRDRVLGSGTPVPAAWRTR